MSPFRTMTEAGRAGVLDDDLVTSSRPKTRNAPAVTSAATSAPTRPPTSAERPPARGPGGSDGGGAQSVEASGEPMLPRPGAPSSTTPEEPMGSPERDSTPAVRRAGAPTNRPRRHPGHPGGGWRPGRDGGGPSRCNRGGFVDRGSDSRRFCACVGEDVSRTNGRARLDIPGADEGIGLLWGRSLRNARRRLTRRLARIVVLRHASSVRSLRTI